MDQITPIEIQYPSQDTKTKIYALLWLPKCTEPRAVVQITHGMEEHIWRYHHFAGFLADQGFVVCGQDMLGHGRSVTAPEELSCLPYRTGKDILIEDAQSLRNLITERYPTLPYIMFGHSMGSFVMRCYAARYGKGLAALILCGTGQIPRALSIGGNMLARMLARVKGEHYRSKILTSMGTGAYSKKIDDPRTELDWLTIDPAVVDTFIADPLCGVPFSAGAYAVLTSLTKDSASRAIAQHIPVTLPVLFIAGALDPVGDKGKGVEKSADLLRRAGVQTVDVKLYSGMRHEILNETERHQVYTDVVGWMNNKIEAS